MQNFLASVIHEYYPSFYTAARLATEEGKFYMQMHDLGTKIAYLQERPREAHPLVHLTPRGTSPL